ncbi:unnamed protein product [Clonostachys byssicola]|uniref:Uncharacterized protein n=1 Tax=Clonostachys byssicola TaxID=160290 RepID=A0A9N9XY26_9HYPO|nr:unnamed protein product [Clonostachys byssicola]
MQSSALVTLVFAAFALCDPTPQASLFPSSGFEGKPTIINDLGGCVNIPEKDDAWYNVHSYIIKSSVECEFYKSEDCERSAGKFRGENDKLITSNIQSVFCLEVSEDEV